MNAFEFPAKSVLVTGGTRGLGKAIGLEFARTGARVFLTHRWGSVDEDELAGEFTAEGLAAPTIVECDASDSDATRELMGTIKDEVGALDVIVSNVAFAKVVRDLSELRRSALELSLGYSAWPVVDLVQASQEVVRKCWAAFRATCSASPATAAWSATRATRWLAPRRPCSKPCAAISRCCSSHTACG
jgi:NAD(P)-dependent dehydrogenase (short-subunit alcohol dehydrogenase family)